MSGEEQYGSTVTPLKSGPMAELAAMRAAVGEDGMPPPPGASNCSTAAALPPWLFPPLPVVRHGRARGAPLPREE